MKKRPTSKPAPNSSVRCVKKKQDFFSYLGVLGVLVGWGRWLQLRLGAPEGRLPGWLAASAMTAVGVLLLLYRES